MSDKQESGSILLILFLIATACLINPTMAETGGLNVAITPKIAEVPIGSSYTLNLTVISTQDFDDTISITVTTDGLPESWKADLSWFDWTFREEQITAGETLTFSFPVTIPGDAGPGYKAFRVVATSAHTGQEAYDTGILSLVALPQPTPSPTPTPPPGEPVLWVGPLEIEVCLNPNETITTTFQIANVGNGSLENVSIVEPDVLWLDVVSDTLLGDMAPGENQTIEVQFNSYDEGVGNHYGTLEVVSDNHPAVEVDVHADITTMPNGTVIFHVRDAYGQPIAGADITLMNQETYDTRINVTDERGEALFVSVPKGDYVYYVYSPDPEHYPGLGTIYVPPTEGCVGSQDVNVTLYVSYVDFEWSVTPTTIQDKYFITLNLTFETDIPVPVLVAVPPRIDDIIKPCGEVSGTLKLLNLGLISLFNVTLSPVEMDNGLTIEFDTDRIAEIKAKSETEVNYTLRLDCSAPECQIFTGRVVARGDYIHFNPFYTAETLYTVDCGDTGISTAPTDVAYNATPGYGYLNGEPSTAWGEEPYQSVRENDTGVRYRFDLEPDKVYQIELTFYDPTSSRNVSVYADGELLKANVELSDTPETITRKIEPQSIYSDGHIIVEIRTNTGDSAVVSEIKVSELYKKQLLGVAGTSVPIRIHSDVCPVPPDFEIPTWNMTIRHLPGGYTRVTYSNAGPCYLPTLRWWGFTGKPIGWSWSIGPYTPPSSHPYHYTPPSYYYNPPSPHIPMPVPVEPLPPAEIKEVTVHEIVKLSISQTATMELEALFAGLRMTNRMWDRSIETIDIDITITDGQGNANDRFFIDVLRLSKINDIDGSGVLGALQTGIISWIIIPKVGAGGTEPDGKNYNVSADIRYTVSGQPILHRTKPAQVVVMPSAQLTLDYYIPSEVKAYKPFKLAVKASNSGFGPAKSFEIETAQPVIYYNPSGLLIDFEIIGSALNGVPRSNSLKVDFGDICPNESKIAWWEMVTTLDGEFTEFTGKYTHSNEFGGTETSRIKDLRTYIIRRQVDTEAAFYDFLVDSDTDYVPDQVVNSSTGEAIDVLTVSYDVVFEPTVADPVLEVNVTKIEDKWIYIPIDDPYNNEASVVAVTRRSDGKVIPAQNYWQQDGKIYVVDDPDVTYDISFNVSNLTAPVLGFVAPTPDNGSVITSNYVQINVSSDKPLTKVVLAWNDVNEAMLGSGYHWYLNKTALSVGEYTFRATGWDSYNLSNETATRTVFIENQIPTASFVYYPEKPVRGQEISFNASSSYDLDGSIVEYCWEFGDETNATGVVVNHTYEWSGSMDMTYNVTLTVTDDFGLTNATTVSVFIAAPPAIVSYSPSSPINDTEGAARTFYVTVSKAVNVTWLINGSVVQTNTSVREASYTNTSTSVGVWNVSAIAADDNGTAVQSWVWNVTPAGVMWLVNVSDPVGDASPPGYDIVRASARNDTSTFFMRMDLDRSYVSEVYSGYAVRIYLDGAIYGLGFCTYSGYWGPHLVVSYDGGESWQPASGSISGSAEGNVITASVDISDIGGFPWKIEFISGIVFSPYGYEVKDSTYLVTYPPADKPDLTLSQEDISFSNPTPTVGEIIIINATIHNIGNATATNVTVQFFDDGMHIGSDQTIRSINAIGTGTAQVHWTATSGSHNISVIVDPYDEIAESNETNNSAFTTIAIGEFTVVQAGNSWIIEPVIGDKSIASFYDYRSASSHTGFEEPYISKIYLYRSTISGELGLIIHHHEDEKYGSGTVKMDFQNVPDGARVVVADDNPSEFSLSQEPEGNWAYSENTDGGAITLPKDTLWSISVLPNFIKGVNAWRLVNGDGTEIELNRGEAVVISYSGPAPASWHYNRTIYIKENSGNDLTDYQVLVNLSENNFPVEANESGADIRFVDENENVLNYWIEEYHYSAKKARIWVNVPAIPANGTVTLQMYWGNPSASAMSSFDDTMEKLDADNSTVALWHFDEGEGAIVYDTSSNGNNGTIYGATWQSQDGGQWDDRSDVMFSNGSALQFDGMDDYVDVPDDDSLDMTTLSLEAWIYLAADIGSIQRRIISHQQNNDISYGLEIFGDGYSSATGNQLVMHTSWGSGWTNALSPTHLNTNQWYHVVGTYDGTNMQLYINGVLDHIQPQPNGQTTNINAPLFIGKSKNAGESSYFFFNGTIDEVVIYNRSLSAEEIKAHYERRKYIYPEPAVSFALDYSAWHYNRTIYIKENSGNDLTDYQVLINLSENNFPVEANESGADIRFVDENENVLNYWIEEYDYSAKSARIWVNVPAIPANGTVTLQMYWGNPGARAMSNFDDTMQKLQVDSSTVALWHFDEGEGAIACDASSNRHNGTIHGATWQVQDGGQWDNRSDVKFTEGSALSFDGVDNYVERSYDADFTPGTNSWTVEAWVKAPNEDTARAIVDWYRCGANPHCSNDDAASYKLRIESNKAHWNVRDDNGNVVTITSSSSVADNTWHHLVGTFNPAINSRKLYVDGVEVNSSSVTLTALSDGGVSIPLEIGRTFVTGWGSPRNYFNGVIDEVAIYRRSLSAEEIKAHYERRKYTSPEPTVTFTPDFSAWHYNRTIYIKENSGNDLTDYQVLINLSGDDFPVEANESGADIRFVDEKNENVLNYWIEEYNYSTKNSRIWVKVPAMPANEIVELQMLWGNPGARAMSDGNVVFEFFDDFFGTRLDTNKWQIGYNPIISFSSRTLTLKSSYSASRLGYIKTLKSFKNPIVIRYKWNAAEPSIWYYGYLGIGNFTNNQYSSVGYVYWSQYESALYSGSSICPPRVGTGQSTEGYIIPDPRIGMWYTSDFIVADNSLSEVRSGNIHGPAGYIGYSGNIYTGIGYPIYDYDYTLLKVDYIAARKYTSAEPTVYFAPDFSTWQHNRTIYIEENSGKDLTDYQVLVNLSGDDFPVDANESGADIRFVDTDGNELNYWIEEYHYSAKKAKIWVNVPEIPANEAVTLEMYWGNPGARAISNGSAVFELFDDFEGTSLDLSKWVVTNTDGAYSISNSILDMSETTGRNEVIACNEGWSAPVSMRYRSYTSRTGSYYDTAVGFHYTNGIVSGWAGAKGNAFIHHGGVYVEAGDGTNYAVMILNISDAWHTFEMRRTGSVTEFYIDDTYQTTLNYDVMGIRYPRFFARNTHLEIDWISICKYASPEPTVTFAPVAAPVDLTLTSSDIVFSNPTPTAGETITINATIHNIGNATATNVTVQFFDNETQIGSNQTIRSINASEAGTAQVTWTATSGSHNISVIVDPYNGIAESNETNNRAYKSITVSDGTGWHYNRTIYIKEKSGNDLTDYQVLVNLSGDDFPVEANESGVDIRFVDKNEDVLNYWIEEYNYSAKNARIWVKVPEMPANEIVALQMLWGNPGASAMTDGDAVFEFFDDFGGSIINTSKWDIISGSATINNGILASTNINLRSKNYFGVNYVSKYSAVHGSGYSNWIGFIINGDPPWVIVEKHSWCGWIFHNYVTDSYGSYLPTEYLSAWHTYEIIRNGTISTMLYTDNSNTKYAELTQQLTTSNLPITLWSAITGSIQVDWIFVRKYTAPEPTVTIGPG